LPARDRFRDPPGGAEGRIYVSYSEAFEPIVNGRIFDPAFGTAGRIPEPISSCAR
jgi:hypothetical protein